MGFIRDYIFNYIGDLLESRIATDIFDKLLGLPLIEVQGENITCLLYTSDAADEL